MDEGQPRDWHLAMVKELKLLALIGTAIAFAEAAADFIKVFDGSGWPVGFPPVLLLEAVEVLRVGAVEGGRNRSGRGGVGEG